MSKVKLLLNVVEDLRSLADSVQAVADAMLQNEPTIDAEPKEPTPAPQKELTLEEVRAVLGEKSRAGFTTEIQALLKKYGAPKLSGIDPKHYEALLKDVEVLKDAPYAETPDFEVLLFGYSADGAPVQVVDLTAGETLPADVRSALTDPAVTKWAFNAQFERVCLSRYLGYPTGQYLDPSSWHCTMVWAATLGLPLSLEGVGAVLGLEKQKLKEGKDLIRYFCTPAKARDGSLIRHYPTDAPEKWSLFKAYNLRDVETEMSIQQKLSKFPVTESEWRNYTLDQQINDRGIMLDRTLVTQAIRCDERFKRTHMEQARSVTGLDNPNSPVQLKAWLAEKGVEADSLSKAAVADMLEKADGEIELALSLRQELAKSSVKKYTAMQTVVGSDNRARGLIQFYGANRTGRYAGRLIQVQNLPQNHLPDLDTARALVRSGNTDAVEMLYDSVPLVLSELIRTAFVPKPGCRFYVADFSAIEARVIAWIAGEHWRQEVFAKGGDIYCASASQMFHVPVPAFVGRCPPRHYDMI